MRKKTWLSTVLVALTGLAVFGVTSSARAEDRFLEQLDPETAYSEIGNSSGVILVDLYANW
jgi:hypothetical protein